MVCSTDRSKAVVPVLVSLLVALWFILLGDLLYVFPCVFLFLCFSVLLVLRLPLLGKRELILVLFVRLFGLCLFRFVGFFFLLGSGKGCVGTPRTFLLLFFNANSVDHDQTQCSAASDLGLLFLPMSLLLGYRLECVHETRGPWAMIQLTESNSLHMKFEQHWPREFNIFFIQMYGAYINAYRNKFALAIKRSNVNIRPSF